MMSWIDMKMIDFQASLASGAATPGGGTVSAVALGQSAALVAMVTELTIGNDKWLEGWEISKSAKSKADDVMIESNALADDDSLAFDQVMAAFKLPKSNDIEIAARRTSIRQATLEAAEIPYKTATLAIELLKEILPLSEYCNANAISDVGVATLLATAGCKGALFNVEINLNSLPMELGQDMRNNIANISEECRAISKEIMHVVKSRL